jgi:hypothetical protein
VSKYLELRGILDVEIMTTYNVNTKIPMLPCALHGSLRANQLYLSKMEANEAAAMKETPLDRGGNEYLRGPNLYHRLWLQRINYDRKL